MFSLTAYVYKSVERRNDLDTNLMIGLAVADILTAAALFDQFLVL
jgi:hypothetical protein